MTDPQTPTTEETPGGKPIQTPTTEETPGGKPIQVADVIDLDAARTDYKPVVVVFRGERYTLGATALSVFGALTLDGSSLEKQKDESNETFTGRLLSKLPDLIRILCPTFPAPPWELGEEVALFRAVTEVLKRVSVLRFSA